VLNGQDPNKFQKRPNAVVLVSFTPCVSRAGDNTIQRVYTGRSVSLWRSLDAHHQKTLRALRPVWSSCCSSANKSGLLSLLLLPSDKSRCFSQNFHSINRRNFPTSTNCKKNALCLLLCYHMLSIHLSLIPAYSYPNILFKVHPKFSVTISCAMMRCCQYIYILRMCFLACYPFRESYAFRPRSSFFLSTFLFNNMARPSYTWHPDLSTLT